MPFIKTHHNVTNRLRSAVMLGRVGFYTVKVSLSGDIAERAAINTHVCVHVGVDTDAGRFLVSPSEPGDLSSIPTTRHKNPKCPTVAFTVSSRRLFVDDMGKFDGTVPAEFFVTGDGVVIRIPETWKQRFGQ
jgi:hypothetical protein